LNYQQALKIEKDRAIYRFHVREIMVLHKLILGLHPGKNPEKPIENMERSIGVTTLSKAAKFVSDRQLRRILHNLRDVVKVVEWKDRKIKYRVDLSFLAAMDEERENENRARKLNQDHRVRSDRGRKAFEERRRKMQPKRIEDMNAFELVQAATKWNDLVPSQASDCELHIVQPVVMPSYDFLTTSPAPLEDFPT
jgi:hypothetical protein